MTTERVSVVVPFYNERDNVAPLLAQLEATFAPLEMVVEYLFVNDGSVDGTREALDALRAHHPSLRVLHLRENRGQSAALVAGMRHARGEFILTLDGDLQNDPADLPRILELLHDYDCVCGVRVKRNDSFVRRLSSRVANRVRQAILHDGIQDAGCGTKGFRRKCVEHIIAFNGVHRFFAVMVRMAGYTLTECPVNHRPREFGESKYGVSNRLWRGIYDLVGVAWLRRRYVTFDVEPEETAPERPVHEPVSASADRD